VLVVGSNASCVISKSDPHCLFTDCVVNILEHNAYVRCLMIDFSTAFDTADHVVLMCKLVQLNLPSSVINWICSFLAGRGQPCKVNGKLSGCSIVQKSGLGSTLYTVMKVICMLCHISMTCVNILTTLLY